MKRKRRESEEEPTSFEQVIRERMAFVESAQEERKAALVTELEQLKNIEFGDMPHFIHARMERDLKLRELESELKELDGNSMVCEFSNRIHPIKNTFASDTRDHRQLKMQSMVSRIVAGGESGPTSVDRNFCTWCGCSLCVLSGESLTVCKKCGACTQELSRPCERVDKNGEHVDTNVASSYDRPALYARYLSQFMGPPPPDEVVHAVYSHFVGRTHTREPCKPTSVAKVLRDLGFEKYIHSNVRICRILNGEPAITFSQDLVDRLKARFAAANQMFLTNPSSMRKTSLNFETLTRQALILEGKHALANKFNGFKNRKGMI